MQSIVKEVVSRIESTPAASAKHGIFAEMNDAIAAAKQAQAVVRNMTMEQREKIITNIRAKTRENAQILARMGVEETGMGNVPHKILKHRLSHSRAWRRRYTCKGRGLRRLRNRRA